MLASDRQILLQLLDYNPLTGELTWKFRPSEFFSNERYAKQWNDRYAGKRAFTAVDAKGYHVGGIFDQTFRANRIIFMMVHGYIPNQVDHEDGNPQNDRLTNLRDVTGQQNQQNMRRSRANQSGVTGVCWDKNKRRWKATIGVDGKTVNLGRFLTIKQAIQARQEAEAKYGFHPNHGR